MRWNGSGEAEAAIIGSADAGPLDLQRQANADMVLQVQYRVDAAPKGPVTLAMGCAGADDAPCRGTVDVTALLKAAPVGQWRTAKIRLTCFRKAGTDMARVDEPFVLGTAAALDLSFAEVRLVADPTDAVCPGQ